MGRPMSYICIKQPIMKAIPYALFLFLCTSFGCLSLSAQCEPDANCKDDDEKPGQMCPEMLPDGTVNQYYESVITVIPPGKATVGGYTVNIVYITLDSVTNLPDGLSWEANAIKFYADSAYCVVVSGTPTEPGTDTLAITVTPFINLAGTITPAPEPVTDDTTVIITINEASGIDPSLAHKFQVLPSTPNPFSDLTRLSVYTPVDNWVELKVYNILGNLVYEEKRGFSPGEHSFDFNGQALQPGTYLFRVSTPKTFHTGKFIKAGR